MLRWLVLITGALALESVVQKSNQAVHSVESVVPNKKSDQAAHSGESVVPNKKSDQGEVASKSTQATKSKKTESTVPASIQDQHSVVGNSFQSSQSYAKLSSQFAQYHSNTANVFLHMLSTPAIALGILVLIAAASNSRVAIGACVAYQILLSLSGVSFCLWLKTSMLLGFLLFVARSSSRVPYGLVLITLGVAGQSVAHVLTKEASLASTYQTSEDYWRRACEHTLLVLPLVIEAAERVLNCTQWLFLATCVAALLPQVFREWFPWQLKYNQVLKARFDADDESVESVREWVVKQTPDPKTGGGHWSRAALDEETGEAFDAIAESDEIMEMFHNRFPRENFTVKLLPCLSEVCVTPASEHPSRKHIHAPFIVYPFSSVFECVVALNANTRVTDDFALLQRPITATTGECFAFDYSREVHVVQHDSATRPDPRMVMRLYYVVSNPYACGFGWLLGLLTSVYHRGLIALGLHPASNGFISSLFGLLSWAFALAEEHIGFCNVLYFALLWRLNDLCPTKPWFLVFGTSYVHYFRYMNTYHHASRQVSAGRFRRDAFLYKSCAMLWLAYYYTNGFSISTFDPDPLSLIVAAIGFGISTLAMKALGMDATYFGVELDVAKPRWITDFPYGVIPHPMIVGQIIGILGLYISAQFRAQAPYMALGHVGLYLVHMAQENFFLPSKYGKID